MSAKEVFNLELQKQGSSRGVCAVSLSDTPLPLCPPANWELFKCSDLTVAVFRRVLAS